jgi:hypothetical protein
LRQINKATGNRLRQLELRSSKDSFGLSASFGPSR